MEGGRGKMPAGSAGERRCVSIPIFTHIQEITESFETPKNTEDLVGEMESMAHMAFALRPSTIAQADTRRAL